MANPPSDKLVSDTNQTTDQSLASDAQCRCKTPTEAENAVSNAENRATPPADLQKGERYTDMSYLGYTPYIFHTQIQSNCARSRM
ncbi:hypothetical protein B0H16DRAFT_1718030 [Mycena metata]|uniref:Uncharacterized protein n=1 Tax=Mycena metata TaxID=1033252 RepID=A0AAD7JL61_9AGAR|nr:hypothetical protein B0H16DRAFT_1751431 [Mycena metata]KAJ7764815.1 hypothetical protein B0H16DRAFT_1718030 [Mycena metata]